ncbi:MAG: GT2 family glycosyltransferase [Flavobacteriaceae bacterium]|jgi:GT2 family glycosyltransferase|tara:strand:- start:5118 stop:6119 length:1002 start_codon:yes stop_codon:yes gene_type:complete
MKPVAVVLLNFNGVKLLKKFLSKVIEFSPEAKVIVIDNGSTDTSVSWIKINYPDLQCISLSENLGYAGGYNEGLKEVDADVYCLLNTDVLVTKNWLPPLLDHFKSNSETGILQPHILDFKKPSHFEYAGAAGGFIDANGFPFCRGRIHKNIEEDKGQYDLPTQVFWASGACFFIRSKLFWEQNGFEDSFFSHQEEIDLCWRVFNAEYKTMALGASKVYHVGGATLAPSPQKVFLNHRNSLLMLTKNVPSEKLAWTLFKRLCWDGLISGYYLLNLNFNSTLAIIKAHYAFYKGFKAMKLKSEQFVKKENFFYTKNILLSYFLDKKLIFKDLNKK